MYQSTVKDDDEPPVPPQRKRALSFEEIEEVYQGRQQHQRIAIQVDDEDESSEESGEEASASGLAAAFHMAEVSPRFQVVRALGKGSFGFVVKAVDTLGGGRLVAIKRVREVFTSVESARRVLSEVRLLRLLGGHPHVTGLLALLVAGGADPLSFDAVYLVLEPCAADLHKVLNSTVQLQPTQVTLPTRGTSLTHTGDARGC
jgi:hypothetical protein